MRTMLVVTGVHSPQILGRTQPEVRRITKQFEIDFLK
jgi:hypothetical protein